MNLSDRLKLAMQAAGVSQADLARACGVKPPSIHGWLSGKAKFLRGENLLQAALVLKVRPDWLATGDGPMEPSDAIDVQARWIDDAQPERAALGMTTALPTLAQALEVLASHMDGLCDSGRELVAQHLQTLARAPDSAKAKAGALASLSGSNLNQQNTVGAEETPSFLKK